MCVEHETKQKHRFLSESNKAQVFSVQMCLSCITICPIWALNCTLVVQKTKNIYVLQKGFINHNINQQPQNTQTTEVLAIRLHTNKA